jgi:hypothetical protein
MQISIQAEPGTTPWVVRPEHRLMLERWTSRPVTVQYVHRDRLDSVPDAPEAPPYAFRAWARPDGRITLLVDPTETYESALWLLIHELAHTDLRCAGLVSTSLRTLHPRDPAYLHDDGAHEADPEEKLANGVADRVMAHWGLPTGLDRMWWRQRVAPQL